MFKIMLFRKDKSKMTAKEFLQQVKKADRMIQCKQEQIESLRALAESITVQLKSDPVQSSGSGDKIGSLVCSIVDLEDKLKADIQKYIKLKKEVISIIDKVDSADYGKILYMRYLQYKTWEQIAVEMNYSYQWVCVLHGRALTEVKKIIENS